jgi:hypothetical protein
VGAIESVIYIYIYIYSERERTEGLPYYPQLTVVFAISRTGVSIPILSYFTRFLILREGHRLRVFEQDAEEDNWTEER